jgi:hypothetical protein
MKTIVYETRDASGTLSTYSIGDETPGELSSLHATADDVVKYACRSSLTPAELFFHRFSLFIAR